MIKVVVTGSECTGKTTLARGLAEHYDTTCASEYARQFVQDKGAMPDYQDVGAIARGQIALEDKLCFAASPLLILDTDLLSTVLYSRHYYGDCPPWIREKLRERAANLYLLAGIDVPWTPDGNQRDRGDRREEMQELFRGALAELELDFVEIRGSHVRRLRLSVAAIDRLLTDSALPICDSEDPSAGRGSRSPAS